MQNSFLFLTWETWGGGKSQILKSSPFHWHCNKSKGEKTRQIFHVPFASWHPIGKQSEAFYQDIPINNPSNYRNRFRGKTRAIPANSNSREQQEVKAGDRSHAPERGCARPAAVGYSASLTARSCMPHLPWGGAQPLPGTKDLPGRETSATAISGCSQRVGPWPRTGGLGLQPVLASLAWAATRTILIKPNLITTAPIN